VTLPLWLSSRICTGRWPRRRQRGGFWPASTSPRLGDVGRARGSARNGPGSPAPRSPDRMLPPARAAGRELDYAVLDLDATRTARRTHLHLGEGWP
jgi:hypothetical protein